MLLRSEVCQRVEDVGIVRGPLLHGPVLHGCRHHVGNRGIEWPGVLNGGHQRLEDQLGESLLHDRLGEDVLAKDLPRRLRRREALRWRRVCLHGVDGLQPGCASAHGVSLSASAAQSPGSSRHNDPWAQACRHRRKVTCQPHFGVVNARFLLAQANDSAERNMSRCRPQVNRPPRRSGASGGEDRYPQSVQPGCHSDVSFVDVLALPAPTQRVETDRISPPTHCRR